MGKSPGTGPTALSLERSCSKFKVSWIFICGFGFISSRGSVHSAWLVLFIVIRGIGLIRSFGLVHSDWFISLICISWFGLNFFGIRHSFVDLGRLSCLSWRGTQEISLGLRVSIDQHTNIKFINEVVFFRETLVIN